MKVVFMGTPKFCIPALEAINEKHELLAVVTTKDKQKNRGRKVLPSPVKETALKHGIKIYQPSKVSDKEFVDILKQTAPDVIVVIAFGQILSSEILKIPRFGCINVHASLLPKYRGAAPVQRAIINGDKITGVTAMFMDEGLDTGDIIETREIEIDKKETTESLFDKLSILSEDIILSTLKKLENNTLTRTKQDDLKASYAAKITKDMGKLDFNNKAEELERLIRGINPWPVAYTFIDNKRIKIYDADIVDFNDVPGKIIVKDKELIIAAGEKALSIKQVQAEGKRIMNIKDFLNGKKIKANFVDN